jgi:hypothetical protein
VGPDYIIDILTVVALGSYAADFTLPVVGALPPGWRSIL